MEFKLLIDPDYDKAQSSFYVVRKYGIDVKDERLVPVVNSKGELIMECRMFICEGSREQLYFLCKDNCLEFRQEYEGAPLYY